MQNSPASAPSRLSEPPEVLHYLGYNVDAGGIVSIIRTLAATGAVRCHLGMNTGAQQRQSPALPVVEFPALAAEDLGLATFWRARSVAREARAWLAQDRRRIVHGHSRAGLAVGLWLQRMGERRVLVSVHTLARRTAFYRWAKQRLQSRMRWLSPAMADYYGGASAPASWEECLPGCIPDTELLAPKRPRSDVVTFGGVGAYADYKRWDLLIAALGRLSSELRTRVRFVHAGGEERDADSIGYAARLRAQADSLGIAPLISWRGRMSPIAPLWAEIDCLLMVSPIEALSIAAMEAIAAGVPVVVSDSSGTRDLVAATGAGWTFAGASAESLAALLARLITTDTPRTWQRNDAGIRQFFASAASQRYLAAYRELLE